MTAAVNSFTGSKSLTVNPSSQASCPHEMQWSCARLTFHSLMSTRSEPHWQNKSTGTDRVYRHGEQKAKCSEFSQNTGENWPGF